MMGNMNFLCRKFQFARDCCTWRTDSRKMFQIFSSRRQLQNGRRSAHC